MNREHCNRGLQKQESASTKMTPKCQYFGTCNGCTCQHIPYDLQVQNKKTALSHAIGPTDITVFKADPNFYRNRMDFLFTSEGPGFRQKDASKRIFVQECVIANKKINHLLNEINSFFPKPIDAFDAKRKTGTFRYAVLRTADETSAVSFVLNSDSSQITKAQELLKQFAEKTTAQTVVLTSVAPEEEESISSEFFVIKGSDMLSHTLCGKKFFYSVQGFFQNNPLLAEKMQQYVHTLLAQYPTTNAHLLDLYSGVGTFGIVNASLFQTTTLIESFPGCIDATKKNIAINKAKNVTAYCLDATKLRRLSFKKPLFVITDPPRSGMDMKTIQQIIELQPEVIVYISCNVGQLGKDVKKFKQYTIKHAALFDFFPQTNHSEAVVLLERNKKL